MKMNRLQMPKIDSYIPHIFSSIDLVKWNNQFSCHQKISMQKVISLFGQHDMNTNCIGFVSESGAEILCCKLNGRGDDNSDAWVSIRETPDFLNEINSFCGWIKGKIGLPLNQF